MRASVTLALLAGSSACAGPAAPPAATGPTIAAMAELGLLMKDEINPAFSRLSFLLFHGDEVEADEVALAAELERNAELLRQAVARMRSLPRVPTQTDEGRAVFFTYADSVERSAAQLVRTIAAGEQLLAGSQLERIAETCNSCHHFFRLTIEDSVVSRSARLEPSAGVALSPAERAPFPPTRD